MNAVPAARVAGAFSSLRFRKGRDRVVELILLLAGLVAVFTTIAIVCVLVYESSFFFRTVSIGEFLTDTMWTPLFADARYGILPLVSGTLTTTMVALLVAIPVGTTIAIYLSEFAPHRLRETVKPILELLGAVPTVVYGYFALLMVTPLLQKLIPGLPGFNMLSAGLVIGLMIVPYVATVERRRDAGGAALHARGLLRDGRDEAADGAARRRAGRAFRDRGRVHPRHLARGGRDHGGRDRGGDAAATDVQSHGAGGDDYRLHRPGQPRRPAARQHRLPEHLRRRDSC